MKKQKETEDALVDYLVKQNRPYSAGDIFNNLHKEYGKAAVVKALETLAESNKIKEKVYGKQKIYAPNQDQYGDYDENEIKSLDKAILDQQAKKDTITNQLKSLENELQSLNCQLTTKDVKEKLQQLTTECDSMKGRIKSIKSDSKAVTAKEKDKIYKENATQVQHWKKRKRMAMNIIDSILESYPKPKKTLYEDVGLETDEDVGAQIDQHR